MSDHPDAAVWLDGALRDPAEARVSWADHGLTVGDGVFETLKLVDGAPFALTRHLDRLRRSAAGMGLDVPDDGVLRAAVEEVTGAWGARAGRLRITLTGGEGPMGSDRGGAAPTLLLVATSGRSVTGSSTVALVGWTRNEQGALAGLKTTSYGENVVALAAAARVGADEALVTNTRSELCEGTGSNVFVVTGGRVLTPPLGSGCLAGITRELLLEAAADGPSPVEESVLTVQDLLDADEVFLTSSLRDVQPVARLHDLRDPHATAVRDWTTPGPLTVTCAQVWSDAFGPGGAVDP